jgi:cellulose synthase/poly-beta-1,6-N-acetylglucosamine synthase-like glycosyltransferase
MSIAEKGYRTVYEPDGDATENASANTKEELKRKIRIAAGGIQSFLRLLPFVKPIETPNSEFSIFKSSYSSMDHYAIPYDILFLIELVFSYSYRRGCKISFSVIWSGLVLWLCFVRVDACNRDPSKLKSSLFPIISV